MLQITKFTLSDRIYPIERTYMRIEDLLRPRQILRAVKIRAIRLGKEPCSFEKHISDIYPGELQLNKANTSDKEISFLDLNISYW